MGECTWGTRRGMGPVASTRIPGIMSGRSYDQQGMAATCEDSTHKATESGERWWDWRMGPYELGRGSNVPRGGPRDRPGVGNAPVRQRGPGHSAVPTTQAAPDTEPGTAVNLGLGARGPANDADWGWMRAIA
jgi:hypothetical protein